MNTRASPATLDEVVWTFDTVAEALADVRLAVGDQVNTRGRVWPGDAAAASGVGSITALVDLE